MRHHRQATIIVDFMYELYHLYDEVALTKEERKCQRKLIQCQEETTHPQLRTKNHPEYSLQNYYQCNKAHCPTVAQTETGY